MLMYHCFVIYIYIYKEYWYIKFKKMENVHALDML